MYRVFFKIENRLITDVKKQAIKLSGFNFDLQLTPSDTPKPMVLMPLIRLFRDTSL